jgi:hypothetical protein
VTPSSTDLAIEELAEGKLRVTATFAETPQLHWWLIVFGSARRAYWQSRTSMFGERVWIFTMPGKAHGESSRDVKTDHAIFTKMDGHQGF